MQSETGSSSVFAEAQLALTFSSGLWTFGIRLSKCVPDDEGHFFLFFLLPISGPLPPFLFFCQLHQFSPLSLLPLPLAFLYDQKSKPLKTLSDQCRTVDTDSLLTATAAPSVCTQTDINHYRLDLEVCANTCMCVCVGVAFALFKWILPDSWYDWWQYKRWRWRGGGVYAKSCESAHMHLFPHSYSQSCRWAVPLGL